MNETERDAGDRPAEIEGYTLYARKHRNRFGDCSIWVYRRKPTMRRTKVESSNIVSIGYNINTHVLEIEFHSGKIYQYSKVPVEEHGALMRADSKGGYFAAHIRNNPNYPYEQVK